MGNQLLDGDAHFLGLGQEAQSVDVFLSAVNPGANQGDFLVAQVEVGVHGALASVDEEAHFAVTAATTDVLVSISSSLGNTGALEDEVSTEALGQSLDLSNALFDGLQFAEVDDVGSAHFLSQVQTGLDTVNSDDVDNTGSLQNMPQTHLEHKLLTASATVDANNVNMLEDDGSVNAVAPLSVVNTRGFDLPQTGDHGTWMFSVIGIIMMAGAAVVILAVSRKKSRK